MLTIFLGGLRHHRQGKVPMLLVDDAMTEGGGKQDGGGDDTGARCRLW